MINREGGEKRGHNRPDEIEEGHLVGLNADSSCN